MTDTELLTRVKAGLGISGDYQNDTIQTYIDEVKAFMLSAGVPQSIINSAVSVGCIMRGVSDLWQYTSGATKFSEHFTQRLTQLALQKYTLDKPVKALTVYVPNADEVTLYGWISNVTGVVKNLVADEFTVTDEQLLKGIAALPNGTEYVDENDGTGNRRRLQFGNRAMNVMPDTIYDAVQSRFIDSVGDTAISVPTTLYGAEITLEAIYKG